MSSVSMQVVTAPAVGRDRKFAYEQEISLDGVGDSDWILIPEDVNSVAVTLIVAGGGKGKVQATTNNIADVIADNATGVDWDFGEVDTNTQDVGFPPTAIRLVQTFAGTVSLKVRAQ